MIFPLRKNKKVASLDATFLISIIKKPTNLVGIIKNMRFSTRAEYGLRALICLAKNEKKKPLSLAQIAQKEKISLAYLERLIAQLKKAKIVLSTKGMKGGYQLARNPEKINLKEIFVALEGSLAPYKCVERGKFLCNQKNCATKIVWQKIQAEILKILNSLTLKDFIK